MLTVMLLAESCQKFLHTLNRVASLMLSPAFLDFVVLKICKRLDHELGAGTITSR